MAQADGNLAAPLVLCDQVSQESPGDRSSEANRSSSPGDYRQRFPNSDEEIQQFKASLFWLGLDQSTAPRMICSWVLFFLMTLLVPLLNALLVYCRHCDEDHKHPYQGIVEISESALAMVSFLCVSHIFSVYGLHKLLLFDYIARDSTEVQVGYKKELHSAFRVLAMILFPSFLVALVHKLWWFYYVSVNLPRVSESSLINAVMCVSVMAAWLYKTTIFLFVCVLFRLLCSLQILRLQSYNKLLEETPDVSVILSEHMRIRDQLLIISHRFRVFMVSSLLTITFSQFVSLFMLTTSRGSVNFFRAGDLAVCSAVQLTGFVVCLNGAARITHRAQRIVAIVSQWHAVATCGTYAVAMPSCDADKATEPVASAVVGPAHPFLARLEATIDICSTPKEPSKYDIDSFQKRQALVTYLQHCNAGISLYGFVLDRGFLYAIFGFELSLVLFILGNTMGFH
ncbi:uncharacterized protein LOC9654438 [Selaginella moellendorffii]|nr:uncharacterized protein LOC9654438 [Selaginella moellendorffii]|eukprot:XP_002983177.2 uncharacterized protein LOC9654438 [Selaginella moellendorffii]